MEPAPILFRGSVFVLVDGGSRAMTCTPLYARLVQLDILGDVPDPTDLICSDISDNHGTRLIEGNPHAHW